MRVVFAGTPEFARAALIGLIGAGHVVPLVLTQPDRPSGRGMKLHPSPVKAAALAHEVAVAQPRSLRLDGSFSDDARAAQAALLEARADVMVVAAYGLILPQWVLDLPVRGCLNIHASLLPRWRGAAPIHRAIEAGDESTGITIMQMDAGLDTGDILLAQSLSILPEDSMGTLHDRLAPLGAQLLVQALETIDTLVRIPQPADGVSYAHKVGKAQAQIDWTLPAAVVERRIRAFDPSPGANSTLNDEMVKVWRATRPAERRDGASLPGTILAISDSGITVACGERSCIDLTELQRPGGKRLPAQRFLTGYPLSVGQRFSAPRGTA